MRSILSRLFSDEFVINEKPLEVHERLLETENGQNGSAKGEDFYSLVELLLKEHDHLSSLTDQLQARSQAGDELEPFMLRLLPFLDSFDRVLFMARNHDVPDEISNWLRSVEGMYFRIMQLLESFGLAPLRTIGRTVDLDFHEVVEVAETNDHPANTVIEEKRKGYVFRGRLLRCASVVVAQRLRQ